MGHILKREKQHMNASSRADLFQPEGRVQKVYVILLKYIAI